MADKEMTILHHLCEWLYNIIRNAKVYPQSRPSMKMVGLGTGHLWQQNETQRSNEKHERYTNLGYPT